MAASPDDMSWLDRLSGILGPGLDQKLQPFGGAQNLGLSLLANSGYSTTPRTFGQTLGISALQSQQATSERANDDLKKRYMMAQIEAMRGKPEGYTLAPGQVRYGADGKEISSVPAAPDLTADEKGYRLAQTQGFNGSYLDYQMALRRAGATSVNLGAQGLSTPPSGYSRPDPMRPGLAFEPGGPADPANKPPPPLTENDKKNQVLYSSMVNAEKQIDALGKSNADTGSYMDAALGANKLTAPLQGEGYRQYEAAGLRWAANMLYLKSGATANPDEIRSTWKQFFPQPGDTQKVKDQKVKSRKEEMSAIGRVMGGQVPPTRPAEIYAPGEAPNSDPLGILK